MSGGALSPEEQEKLLAGLEDRDTRHLQTLIPLLLLTGMRSGEALSLTWAQVDLMAKTITVGRAKSSNGTGPRSPLTMTWRAFWSLTGSGSSIVSGSHSRITTYSPGASPSRPIRPATQPMTLGAGMNCGRIPAYPAVSTISGARLPRGSLKMAFLSPRC